MYMLLFLFVFTVEFSVISCTPKCEDFTTCGTCILSTFDNCEWCAEENYKGKRCQSKIKTMNGTWCSKPMSKSVTNLEITKNDSLSNGELGTKIVQFTPQKLTIKSATPGFSVNIPMFYQPAKDAPLDIYFLIDNSGNIAQYKKDLSEYATSIFEEVKNYTNNVRIGLGTFVEKPILPYADPDVHNVYVFKNHLSLINKTEIFESTLNDIKSGSNYDFPEDILDALMQVMLCKEEIDWRKDSRRIIVVITNAFFHFAGDGKMLGAFERHNMKCQNDNTTYTVMDYPSIGQISKVAKEGSYVPIIAYMDKNFQYAIENHYKQLSEKVSEIKFVKLSGGNIAKMIKDEYIKIIQDVNIVPTESSPAIQITIKKKCQNCIAMHFNPVEFLATFEVISCPTPRKYKEIIKITPTSLNEGLDVEVEFNCQCECEEDDATQFNSSKCNGYGDYQCGTCKCKSDRSGDDCACKIDSENSENDYEKCRKNSNDTLRCSGHGECSCGKCLSCYSGFFGQFCEFDENACPRPGGKLCSGHGLCTMGICACDSNWVHSPNGIEDCGCTLDQRSCIAPHSNKICSGYGECECGRCICNIKENSNDTCSGRYCDKCSESTTKRCEELEDYAYCKYLNQTLCQDISNVTDTIVVFANRSEINSPDNIEWYMANWCRATKGDDESIFVFKYYYSSDTNHAPGTDEALILVIQKELEEKPPADIWVPVGSAIGGILLIGLLSLLLWKILTDIYDAREYNQFRAKALAAGYNVNMIENPWYEPPTTTFVNPAHNPQL